MHKNIRANQLSYCQAQSYTIQSLLLKPFTFSPVISNIYFEVKTGIKSSLKDAECMGLLAEGHLQKGKKHVAR